MGVVSHSDAIPGRIACLIRRLDAAARSLFLWNFLVVASYRAIIARSSPMGGVDCRDEPVHDGSHYTVGSHQPRVSVRHFRRSVLLRRSYSNGASLDNAGFHRDHNVLSYWRAQYFNHIWVWTRLSLGPARSSGARGKVGCRAVPFVGLGVLCHLSRTLPAHILVDTFVGNDRRGMAANARRAPGGVNGCRRSLSSVDRSAGNTALETAPLPQSRTPRDSGGPACRVNRSVDACSPQAEFKQV